MWEILLQKVVSRIIRAGTLVLKLPSGRTATIGDGTGTPVEVTLSDPSLPRRLVLNPELALGEGYVDQTLTIGGDDLKGLLALALENRSVVGDEFAPRIVVALRYMSRFIRQYNPARRSKANVAHHYDLSGELYDLFLDPDRQYSCAYFKSATDTLEQAQAQKKKHIADKLLISPGMRVLDIGCGWGGMALTLARDYGARVVGVTLSEEQHKLACQRVKAAGLSDQIDIRLQDYREVEETFDRIVSVGMFEHVGVPQYRTYFGKVRDLLTPDGIALIHTIGRTTPPGTTSPWIEKYIFPGGYCPSMSETMVAVEKEDLYPTDVEIWRLHYAETLKHWHTRFMANADKARALYDDRFVRMWRFYLLACEMTFRHDHQCVFQFQLARTQEAVPLTRDYLYPAPREAERAPEKHPVHSHAAE